MNVYISHTKHNACIWTYNPEVVSDSAEIKKFPKTAPLYSNQHILIQCLNLKNFLKFYNCTIQAQTNVHNLFRPNGPIYFQNQTIIQKHNRSYGFPGII